MKKGLFFLFVIIFVVSVFTGCENPIQVKKVFTSGIYVSTEDIDFMGSFKRNKDGEIYLKVTYPEDIKGYTYQINDDKVKIEYMGIRDKYNMEDFPDTAPIKVLHNVFEDLEEDSSMKKTDKGYVIDADDFTVTVDSKGYITNIKDEKIEISFVNQKEIKST